MSSNKPFIYTTLTHEQLSKLKERHPELAETVTPFVNKSGEISGYSIPTFGFEEELIQRLQRNRER